MTFTYSRTIARGHDPIRDEYHEDTYEFDYEPSEDEIVHALADILTGEQYKILNDNEYKKVMQILKGVIVDHDLKDILAEDYQDELKDWFEDEALESEGG